MEGHRKHSTSSMSSPAHLVDRNTTSHAVPRFGKNGVALSEKERASIARRKGVCVSCGVKTHAVSLLKKSPLTHEHVYKGICIKCNPSKVPPRVLHEYEERHPQIVPMRRRATTTPAAAAAANNSSRQPRTPFPDRRLSDSSSHSQSNHASDSCEVVGVEAYLVVERRPVAIQVEASSLTQANGVYQLDRCFFGSFYQYLLAGYLEDAQLTPVIFVIHKSSTRWFLSAVLENGGRVYLYCAPNNHKKSPPTRGWAKMNGVPGTASLTLQVLRTEEVPSQEYHHQHNARSSSVAGLVDNPHHNPPSTPTHHCNTIQEDQEEIQLADAFNNSSTSQKSQDLLWDAHDSSHISLEDYGALPDVKSMRGLFPWETMENNNNKATSSEATLQFDITTSNGTEFIIILDATPSTTVQQLKSEIRRLQGIPIHQQELTIERGAHWITTLENKQTLFYYNLHEPKIDLKLKCPPGYPCQCLLIDLFAETQKVRVQPSDTIQLVLQSIRATPWFNDQFRYTHPDHVAGINLQLSYQGQILDNPNVTLAELDLPNETTFQLEVLDKTQTTTTTPTTTLNTNHALNMAEEDAKKLELARKWQEEAEAQLRMEQRAHKETQKEPDGITVEVARAWEEKLAAKSADFSTTKSAECKTQSAEVSTAEQPKQDIVVENPEEKTDKEPDKDDLAAQLARCRAYQQEVLQNIALSSASKSSVESDSESDDSASFAGCKEQPPTPLTNKAKAAALMGDIEDARTTTTAATTHDNRCHDRIPSSVRTIDKSKDQPSATPTLFTPNVQTTTNPSKPSEEANPNEGEPSPTPTPNPKQQVVDDDVSTSSCSLPKPTTLGGRSTTLGDMPLSPVRHMKRSEHSQRIARLEDKVAAYEKQLNTLLKVMEITHTGDVSDEITQMRVELAHKILRGENDAVLEKQLYGLKPSKDDKH